MTAPSFSLKDKNKLLTRLQSANAEPQDKKPTDALTTLPESFYQIEKLADYHTIHAVDALVDRAQINSPFFIEHEGITAHTTSINKASYINFSSYNYLGLCGHPAVSEAAIKAIHQYGTSASASRIVAGERPIHRQLENAIGKLYNTGSALTFVSGHATNVTTIGHLFNRNDLILYDSLSHNSIAQGIKLSGAKAFAFPHNDTNALERFLSKYRADYEKVLIVTEGLFSMDGDTPPLNNIVEIKKRYKCFLMVDEAHSIGTLGATGKGIAEAQSIAPHDVDIWMGTLSKTFAGCGGYIAGNKKLIEHLRYTAPGFLYSVGMAPPVAAASLAAIELMLAEPDRIKNLQSNSLFFLELAKAANLDTGDAEGHAIIPIVVGQSLQALQLSDALLKHQVHVQPIIYPAVAEPAARLRFFISALHTKEQLQQTVNAVCRAIEQNPSNS